MALCSSCQAFDIQTFKKDPSRMCGYKQGSVEKAGSAGCTFCAFLCENLSAELQEAYLNFGDDSWIHMRMSKDHSAHSASRTESLGCNTLDIILAPRDFLFVGDNRVFDDCGDRCIISSLEIRVVADTASAAATSGDVIGRYLGDDPTSEAHFQKIQQWIGECLSGHIHCCRTASGAVIDVQHVPLPTRCIDVRGRSIKLQDTSEISGRYVILSHRWTEHTYESRTVMENLEARKEDIDLFSLPKTFQDAVSITRRLDVPYLWIDSLCIIQDDYEDADWRREAPRMGHYFQSSFFTISAAGASNGTDGCFQGRPLGISGPLIRLPYRDSTGHQRGHFYIHKRDLSVTQEYVERVRKSELIGRGWVLQERLLSRRILHFTESQLFFECAELSPRSECSETVFIDPRTRCMSELSHTPSADVSSLWHNGETAFMETTTWDTNISHSDHWYTIVEQYSGLALSIPKQDRLAAVAGIAEEFQQILGKGSTAHRRILYLAGLWLEDIHYGLLWEACEEGGSPKLSGCETPTWSWATYLSVVRWPGGFENMEKSCEILGLIDRDEVLYDLKEGHDPGFRSLQGRFGVLNTCCHLKILGKRRYVFLKGEFPKNDLEHIKVWTGVDRDISDHGWRPVYDAEDHRRQAVVGWASIEDASVHARLTDGGGALLAALHISTTTGIAGGIEFGYFGFTHPVYNAIFLQQASGSRFRRVGVGKIFCKRFFDTGTEQEVILV